MEGLTGNDIAERLGMSLIDLKGCFPKKSKKGDVYLLKNNITGLVKIGRSGNLPQRKRSLEIGAGTELDCIYNVTVSDSHALEATLHATFKANMEKGEWYCLNKENIQIAINVMEASK